MKSSHNTLEGLAALSLQFIPAEILFMVIDRIPQKDRKTLSMVSKYLNATLLPYLFTKLNFTGEDFSKEITRLAIRRLFQPRKVSAPSSRKGFKLSFPASQHVRRITFPLASNEQKRGWRIRLKK
jgi:hypothetical protein